MKRVLGAILIGQTPRKDYEELLNGCLSENDELIMLGALDDLNLAEIQQLKPIEGEGVLATLSRENMPIVVSEQEVIKRIPEKIRIMEKKGASLIVIICTGQFPEFNAKVPIVFPSKVLLHNVKVIAEGKKVGVIVPLDEQKTQLKPRWVQAGVEPVFGVVSPFTENVVMKDSVKKLTEQDVMLIVMDCMKYDQQIKEEVMALSGKPVIAARTLLTKYLSELLCR